MNGRRDVGTFSPCHLITLSLVVRTEARRNGGAEQQRGEGAEGGYGERLAFGLSHLTIASMAAFVSASSPPAVNASLSTTSSASPAG